MKKLRWDTKCKRDAMSLTLEKRQEFLDYMWDGLSLGEAQKKAGLNFDEANGILMLNIKSVDYFRKESL